MKISPVAGPGAIPPNGTPEAVRTSRAVEAFNRGQSSHDKAPVAHQQPQTQVVNNQNAVSVEELGAITSNIDKLAEVEAQVEDTTPQEAPKAETPAPEAKDPALSRQFAQLARQEKALRLKAQQQEQAYRAREEALKAREAQLTAQDQKYSSGYYTKDQIRQNALDILSEAGVSYDELTQQQINQHQRDPRMDSTINELRNEIKALKQANDNSQKTYQDKQTADYNAAVRQIELDVKSLVKNDPYFETIKATGSAKDVVELITETYNKDGILLTVEEASKEVEDYLVDEALKFTRIDKIKKRLGMNSASNQAAPKQTQPAPKQTQPMKTLTNATSSTRQLSVRERAIAAMEGRLKP